MSKPRPQAERVSDLRENIGGTGGKLIRCDDGFGGSSDTRRMCRSESANCNQRAPCWTIRGLLHGVCVCNGVHRKSKSASLSKATERPSSATGGRTMTDREKREARRRIKAHQSCERAFGSLERAGSASPDCCSEWTRSAWRLNVAALSHCGMVSKPDDLVRFCPWCGRVRPNAAMSDRADSAGRNVK